MHLKKLLLFAATLVLSAQLFAQTLTQTVRGTVVDVDSKYPLPGAVVRIGRAHGVPTPVHDMLYAVLLPTAQRALS